MLTKNKILNMDCREGIKLLENESIDCCITSPPYWGLRDYGVDGQIGLEVSLNAYLECLVQLFREIKRVLKPGGTVWLNLGDSYVGTGGDRNSDPSSSIFAAQEQHNPTGRYQKQKALKAMNLKPKNLIGIPWRVAFALQDDGWYLRQDNIWHKPNCMPEAVKDRTTRAHEYIFLLSKEKNYYYDHEIIKEDCVNGDASSPRGSKGVLGNQHKGNRKTFRGSGKYTQGQSYDNTSIVKSKSQGNESIKILKRNKRSVWTVATAQHKDAHFATFPEKLIEPCVLAGCPEGGLIIDPFMGSGTVGKVALENRRNFIGYEINSSYCEIAKRRTSEVQLRIL